MQVQVQQFNGWNRVANNKETKKRKKQLDARYMYSIIKIANKGENAQRINKCTLKFKGSDRRIGRENTLFFDVDSLYTYPISKCSFNTLIGLTFT